MSGLISLGLSQPDLIKHGTTADVVDAHKARADFESNAPTGLPSMTDVEAWENILIGVKTNTGQTVTPEKAKRCATVLAIMRGLQEDVGCLGQPLMKRGDLEDVRAITHPADRICNMAPNDLMTPLEVRERMMMDLMTYGGFFNLLNFAQDYNNLGQLESIWPLQAAYVTRRAWQTVWTFTDPLTGRSGEFDQSAVWRGTILSGNGLDGTAITLLCREAIGLLLAAEEQGARLFKQGVQTDLALELPVGEDLDADGRKQLRDAFMSRHAGSQNAFMPIVLENGMKANKLGLTAQESQYLEARGFQVGEIARAFRYPEVLLGSMGKNSKSATFASASQFFESYTKHTLGPWGTRIQQTANRDLLSTKEQTKYYFEHDFSNLLKADELARIANWNAKITGGWAQPQEARRAEKMPYKPGLDYFNRSLNQEALGGAPPPPKPAPTDQSGSTYALAIRVGDHMLSREYKAVIGQKQDADIFYTGFGGYIEGLTGANTESVRAYLESRRNLPADDRFSPESTAAARTFLTNLCKGQTNA
jgi:HK97 family phage portal protein